MEPRAGELIRSLGLVSHPEGGWYRETFRSARVVRVDDGRGSRCAVTSIWFLLAAGEFSRWHRVRSDEAWHLLEGGPLELSLAPPTLTRVERAVLGPVCGEGSVPARVVPAEWWQAARPLGGYALAACVVAPGFEFEDFALLADQPGGPDKLRAVAAEVTALL